MWFDELMESCKVATRVLGTRPGLILPWILGGMAMAALGLVVFVIIMFMTLPLVFLMAGGYFAAGAIGMVVLGTLLGLVLALPWSAINAGFITMLGAALDGEDRLSDSFWRGFRRWSFPMWSAHIILVLLVMLASPLIIVVYVLGLGASLLTGGLALFALNLVWFVYLYAWPIAVVEEGQGWFAPIKSSFRLGKAFFPGLVVLALASMALPTVASYLGPLGFMVVGWVVGIAVNTWLRLVVIIEYRRRRLSLLPAFTE